MEHCLRLKKSNCKNCHKCIRHCPVKAIRFSGDQAHIIADECILCGQCFVVCPQNAKRIQDDTERVKVMIKSGVPVYASLAPSFIANYRGSGIDAMRDALKKLGFTDAEETAIGATIVKREYDRIVEEGNESIVISSCCASVDLLIQKHFPQLLNRLADIASPMQAHAVDIKMRHPDAKVVFIGPCVAKKDEAARYGDIVDAALTFEELTKWMEDDCAVPEKTMDENDESLARFFPVAGGILKTMNKKAEDYMYMVCDGVENCLAALEDIEKGEIDHCFIEMSACTGSCVNGPVMAKYRAEPVRDYISVARYAGSKDFPVEQPKLSTIHKNFEMLKKKEYIPNEDQIKSILRQMGKNSPEDELNCETCGYHTCRDKAIAVYQGKAEITMCLPYLRERSESLSNIAFDNTPNGIVVVNELLEIQQINPAACELMNIRSPKDVLGDGVVSILDPKPFFDALDNKSTIRERVYLAEYEKHVEQTVIYDAAYHMIFCLLRDVSENEEARVRKEEMRLQTTEIADKVVEKQMRIVQEIASLLGETTAETKIALTQLKESMSDDE